MSVDNTARGLALRGLGNVTQDAIDAAETAQSIADSLTTPSDASAGAALVGWRGTTVAGLLDRSQPQLNLARLKGKLATIVSTGAGTASIAFFGDSICRSLIADQVYKDLWDFYGFRGIFCSAISALNAPLYDLANLSGGTASGSAVVASRWTSSPNGNVFVLDASGERVTFSDNLVATGQRYVNRATLVYVKKPSGGVFKLQTLRADAGEEPQDVAGSTAVDTSNATVQWATIQVNLPAREKGARLSALWQSGGEVEIIGCLMEDTTAAGVILSWLDQGGIYMGDTNTMSSANLSVLLNVLTPDLITWSMKDGVNAAAVSPLLTAHQTLWDAAYTTNWLYIAPYPDSVSDTLTKARDQGQPIIDHALANGHDYWDTLLDVPTYAYGVAQGWFSDTTHLGAKGTYALSPRLWRASGLLPGLRAGSLPASSNGSRPGTFSTLSVNGKDYDQSLRDLRTGAMQAARRGVKFAASGANNIVGETTTTAPGTGSYTIVAFVRVPSGTFANIEVAGLRTGIGGSNQNGSAHLVLQTNGVGLLQRTAAGVTNSFLSSEGGVQARALVGEIVMLTARRDAAAATGVAPIALFVDSTKFIPGSQTALDPLTSLSGSRFKVGCLAANVGANEVEMFGAAYYTSALTDTQIAWMALTGQFVSGADTAWQFNEQTGGAVGKRPAKVGRPQGTVTWSHGPISARLASLDGTSIQLYPDDMLIADSSSGTRTTATLPTAPQAGDFIEISGRGSAGWAIAQNAGNQIVEGAGTTVGTNATTAGVTGTLSSSARYDSIRLRCVVADSVTPSYIWAVERKSGTLTYA